MKLLDRNASTRIGSKGGLYEILAHPFFNEVDFEALQARTIDPPYKPDEEQMTLKESEFRSVDVKHCSELHDIKVEDEQDVIPAAKKKLIQQNQQRFDDF